MTRLLQHTKDREEAHRLLTSSYGPHEIALARPGTALDFHLWWDARPSLRVGYSHYGTDVRIEAPPLESWIVVCFPTRGHLQVSSGDDSLRLTPNRGAVLRPFERLRWEKLSDDCTMLSLQVSRGALEDELGAMLGRPVEDGIRFALDFDLRPARGGAFPSALQFLHDVVAERRDMPRTSPRAEPPAMMERLDRLVLTALLVAQPHDHTDELTAPARAAPPSRIRRVIEQIDADPARFTTAADLASVACLSVRALEEGFRRSLGMPPMRYLRDVRLARARELLAAADPGETSVTDVALRCGFLHLGRFATAYRRKYGTSPSETLRGGGRSRIVSRATPDSRFRI